MKALNLVSLLWKRSSIKFHHTLERRIMCYVCFVHSPSLLWWILSDKSHVSVISVYICFSQSKGELPASSPHPLSLLEDLFLSCWALLSACGLFLGLDFSFIIVSFGVSNTVLYILFILVGNCNTGWISLCWTYRSIIT